MSLLTKGLMIGIFFTLLVSLIALLPSVSDYPLPPQIALSLTIILGYVFAWTSVFWFINIWFAIALLSIGFELAIWTAKKVIWITTWVARLFA